MRISRRIHLSGCMYESEIQCMISVYIFLYIYRERVTVILQNLVVSGVTTGMP